MTWNLFLDDERSPKDVFWASHSMLEMYETTDWVICRTVEEVKAAIEVRGMPNFISFDHDLGEDQPDGYFITKLLCEIDDYGEGKTTFADTFNFCVHSKNPIGEKNIRHYIENYLKNRD